MRYIPAIYLRALKSKQEKKLKTVTVVEFHTKTTPRSRDELTKRLFSDTVEIIEIQGRYDKSPEKLHSVLCAIAGNIPMYFVLLFFFSFSLQRLAAVRATIILGHAASDVVNNLRRILP